MSHGHLVRGPGLGDPDWSNSASFVITVSGVVLALVTYNGAECAWKKSVFRDGICYGRAHLRSTV